MIETLLLETTNRGDVLFNFTPDTVDESLGIWRSQGHGGDSLYATSLSTPLQLNEFGVNINGMAARRLQLNRALEGYVNTSIIQFYANPGAKGRVGIFLGNYPILPAKNIELYDGFKFRIYGSPGDAIGKAVPSGRLVTLGYTTDLVSKVYRIFIDGEFIEALPFSSTPPKKYTGIHYIGGDTRTSYAFQGAIRSLVGYRTTKSDADMMTLTTTE